MGVAVYQDNIWLAGGISKNPQTPVLKSVICYDTITNGYIFENVHILGDLTKCCKKIGGQLLHHCHYHEHFQLW
jgi:hypothetical protein